MNRSRKWTLLFVLVVTLISLPALSVLAAPLPAPVTDPWYPPTPRPTVRPTSVMPTLTPVPPNKSVVKNIELINADKWYQLTDPRRTKLELPGAMTDHVNLAGWSALAAKMGLSSWNLFGVPGDRIRITGGDVHMALAWTCLDRSDPENIKDNIVKYAGECKDYYGLVIQSWQMRPHDNPWESGWEYQIVAAMFRRSQYIDTAAKTLTYHLQYPMETAEWLASNSLFDYPLAVPKQRQDGFWSGESWIKKGQSYSFVVPSGEEVPFFHYPYASRASDKYSERTDGWAKKGTMKPGEKVTGIVTCGVYMGSHGASCDPFLMVKDSSFTPWGAKFISVEDLLSGHTVPPEFRPATQKPATSSYTGGYPGSYPGGNCPSGAGT